MALRLSHVAVTVPRARTEGEERDALIGFHAEVFGWEERLPLSVEVQYLRGGA